MILWPQATPGAIEVARRYAIVRIVDMLLWHAEDRWPQWLVRWLWEWLEAWGARYSVIPPGGIKQIGRERPRWRYDPADAVHTLTVGAIQCQARLAVSGSWVGVMTQQGNVQAMTKRATLTEIKRWCEARVADVEHQPATGGA